MNERQEAELDAAVAALWDDLFLEGMDEGKTERWERMLGLKHLDTDTLQERRFRVQAKVLERMPYTFRVILRKLRTLCPEGLEFIADAEGQNVMVKVALASKNMREDIAGLLEDVLPLNMTYAVIILYNTYGMLDGHAHGEMGGFTHLQLREDVTIGGA